MKKNYVSPVLEQIDFDNSEIVTGSGIFGVEDDLTKDIVASSLDLN